MKNMKSFEKIVRVVRQKTKNVAEMSYKKRL